MTTFAHFYAGQIKRLYRDYAKNEEYKKRQRPHQKKEGPSELIMPLIPPLELDV